MSKSVLLFSFDSSTFIRFLCKFNDNVINGKNVGGENNCVTFMLLCCQLCWCNLWQKPLLNINGYLKFTVDIDGISEPFDSKVFSKWIGYFVFWLHYNTFDFYFDRWAEEVSSLFWVLLNLNFIVSAVSLYPRQLTILYIFPTILRKTKSMQYNGNALLSHWLGFVQDKNLGTTQDSFNWNLLDWNRIASVSSLYCHQLCKHLKCFSYCLCTSVARDYAKR